MLPTPGVEPLDPVLCLLAEHNRGVEGEGGAVRALRGDLAPFSVVFVFECGPSSAVFLAQAFAFGGSDWRWCSVCKWPVPRYQCVLTEQNIAPQKHPYHTKPPVSLRTWCTRSIDLHKADDRLTRTCPGLHEQVKSHQRQRQLRIQANQLQTRKGPPKRKAHKQLYGKPGDRRARV